MAVPAAHKKNSSGLPTASSAARAGVGPCCPGRPRYEAAIRAIAHTQHAISRAVAQLATHGLLPAAAMASLRSHQPAVALRRVAPHRGRDLLAGREGLRVARGHRDVPGGLDERAAHVGVARAGYPALDEVSPLECSEGASPHHEAKRRRAREPGGVAHLAGEQERGGDVDALHAPERVHGRLPLRPPGGLGDPPRQRVARLPQRRTQSR